MSRRTRSQTSIVQQRTPSQASIVQQRTLSQASIVRQRNVENNDDELNEQIDKCVRYFIYRSGSNEPIKKTELKKALPTAGRRIDRIVQKAGETLDKVYGFKLVACDNTAYVTVQNIDNSVELDDGNTDGNEDDVPDDIRKVLVMLVLTNIFMSTNSVNEASLFMYLKTLGIEPDNDKGIFGKIKDFVNSTMVKQGYLVMQSDPLSREITYKWGSRAENTISKHKILNFVSKIYGDKQPSSWETQYEEANQQFDNNNVNEVGEVVHNNV